MIYEKTYWHCTRHKKIYFFLSTVVTGSYFAHQDNLLQNAATILLQNATALLLQNATKSYFKMRQVFYYNIRQL